MSAPTPAPATPPALPGYAELQCCSNFSFLRGAAWPQALVERAHALGYAALALADECSVAGVVRAHTEAQRLGLHLLVGAQFRLAPDLPRRGPEGVLVVLARQRRGYAQLCGLITRARAGHPKGEYLLGWSDVQAAAAQLDDCLLLWSPARECLPEPTTGRPEAPAGSPPAAPGPQPSPYAPAHAAVPALAEAARQLQQAFEGRCWIGACLQLRMDDRVWLAALQAASEQTGVPLVAVGDVQFDRRSAKPLHDVLAAIRLRRPLADCGWALQPNAEAHLRSRLRLAQMYPPALLAETLRVAAACRFRLDELRYEYPQEVVPPGHSPTSHLRQCVEAGVRRRYPQGEPPAVRAQIEHELALITELGYEKYFLTVHDVVGFARGRGILCQGRGSAANSVVCYCLGVTEVDPARNSVLFERFISRARNEPPDIDVDFEHQRREEVIQYLYAKYGRGRAALVGVVISYRLRSAVRDVGFALGIDPAVIDAMARRQQWWDRAGQIDEATAAGESATAPPGPTLPAGDARLALWRELVEQLLGFPRHLSQHPGGFVLTGDRLDATVPVVAAAMPGRTCIEWDKDDIDAVGLLKVDVLALGMLTALQRSFQLITQWRGRPFGMSDVPSEDGATYDMLCAADTVGVFQVESRAQQSMLPRLQPRVFYDLVVQVAIVRPGPIQGGMVHPYLRRRQQLEPATVPPGLEVALQRTLGVPIFQEQVMQVAMIGAGFSADEADDLRRGMAAWRRKGGLERFRQRLIDGMTRDQRYTQEFAEAIFQQMQGFGEYGFPESHAASFALLAYASAWVKRHEPACFLAALLNSQPMGFYGPSQLVQDARRHGVEVRPVDVLASDWDSTLEAPAPTPPPGPGRPAWPVGDPPQPAVRLGLHRVRGLGEAVGRRIVQAVRQQPPVGSVQELALRAGLEAADLAALAAADALAPLAGHRRQQVWAATALHRAPPLLREAPVHEAPLQLPLAPEGEEVVFDHAATGLTLRRHPLALLRPELDRRHLFTAAQLQQVTPGHRVQAAGLVTVRQRPGTAKGTVFVTLEDETGVVNVIVWPRLRDRQRSALLHSRLLAVDGVWQREGAVTHLIARRLRDLSPLLDTLGQASLSIPSRDFH